MYYCWHTTNYLFLNLLLTLKKKPKHLPNLINRFFPPRANSVCLLFLWDLKQLTPMGKLPVYIIQFPIFFFFNQ